MNDDELRAQWRRCEAWHNAEQWELLAVEYARRGYNLNAKRCFERADECLMNDWLAVPLAANATV